MNNKLIILFLVIGIIYRLFLTSNGNFLFNMDNARDMVDVREMVEVKKLRLTGPTSAIEGFYNGPAWYYLLAVPYILSGGDPYASIIMEVVLWAIGGFFLLKLVERWGKWLVIPIGAIWVSSTYIVLTNLYAFNPNPVTLLTPLLIYLLVDYMENGKGLTIISAWVLSGLFFNFEMNFGVFTPLIIFFSLIATKKWKLLKDKYFWVGAGGFILTLLPQLLFDFRHQFIMSKSLINFLSQNQGQSLDLVNRFKTISTSFYHTFLPILLNHKYLTWVVLLAFIPAALKIIKNREKKDTVVLVSFLYIIIPFLGYLFLPVTVNAWHLGGPMAASIILIGFLLKKLFDFGLVGIFWSLILTIAIIFFSTGNIINFFVNDLGKENMDPSLYKNEIAAIDYVYNYASGQNFKVYTYLPSVYDYPYQYLFWWHGKKKYGYIPGEYVYSPNKPQYIPGQEKFSGRKDNFSGLVFLIKEPDRIKMRQAWENDYKDMEFISKEMVGPIEVEIREEKSLSGSGL